MESILSLTISMLKANSIVIVEDNDDDVTLLMRQLRKVKLERHVKFIHDGAQAHTYLSELVIKEPGDLVAIFLDLNLPTMNGLELFRRIRRIKKIRNVPVVVMTSSNSPADLEECDKLDVAKFLSKPISFDRFLQAVAIVLPSSHPTETSGIKIE